MLWLHTPNVKILRDYEVEWLWVLSFVPVLYGLIFSNLWSYTVRLKNGIPVLSCPEYSYNLQKKKKGKDSILKGLHVKMKIS